MSWIVLDASVTLSWCFPDEQTPASMRVLDMLKAGDQVLVPAFWCSEVLNSLLVGERKGRISASQEPSFPGVFVFYSRWLRESTFHLRRDVLRVQKAHRAPRACQPELSARRYPALGRRLQTAFRPAGCTALN